MGVHVYGEQTQHELTDQVDRWPDITKMSVDLPPIARILLARLYCLCELLI